MLAVSRILLLATLVIAALATEERSFAQSVENGYQLKAVFIYKFPQFVEWPAPVWQDGSSVQFCVVQPNPFGTDR
jgi:hypothetical protein